MNEQVIHIVDYHGTNYSVKDRPVYVTFPTGLAIHTLQCRTNGGALPDYRPVIQSFLDKCFPKIVEMFGAKRAGAINGLILLNAKKAAEREEVRKGAGPQVPPSYVTREKGLLDFHLCKWIEATPETKGKLEDIFGDPF